jgi:hypothetical protein
MQALLPEIILKQDVCPRIGTNLHEWRWDVVSASQKQHPTAVFNWEGIEEGRGGGCPRIGTNLHGFALVCLLRWEGRVW